MCSPWKAFFSFYLTPDKQTGRQERGRLSFVELPYAPQMQYLCLFLFCFICFTSLCCCNGNSVFLGFVPHSIRHRYSKVMCQQQCVTLFLLLTSCFSFVSWKGTSQFLSVTFPVSNAATAYRLGNCDKLTLWRYKGFGDGLQSGNFFTLLDEII